MPHTQIPGEITKESAQIIGQLMLLAKVTLAKARKGNTEDLLSASVQFMDTCDYTAVTSHLKSVGVLSTTEMTTDYRTTVFQALGRIYCTWPEPAANAFTERLVCHIGRPSHTHMMDHVGTLSSNIDLEERQAGDERLGRSEDEKKVSEFTQRLFEEGQKRGQPIQRSYSQVCLDPPLFSANVKFSGVATKAYGRSKKEAAHLAAQIACEQLGVGC